MSDANNINDILEQLASVESMLFLGAVSLDAGRAFESYEKWLAEKKNAGMVFLENNKEIRSNPELLLGGAKSLFVFGYQYGPQVKEPDQQGKGRIASYARMRDYHRFLRRGLESMIVKLIKLYPASDHRPLVDSAPILERSFAAKTFEGFIGKNTCYIHPSKGSFILLSEIISTIEVETNVQKSVDPNKRSKEGGCGPCKRCQVHCPTGALNEDYTLDANKCLSYWTIEHRGLVPKKWWPYFKDYIFGCDICQNVCPYNRNVSLDTNITYKHPQNIDLYQLATLSQEDYVLKYGGTPLTRAKRTGLRRNALIAMYIAGDRRLNRAISYISKDPDAVLSDTAEQMHTSDDQP